LRKDGFDLAESGERCSSGLRCNPDPTIQTGGDGGWKKEISPQKSSKKPYLEQKRVGDRERGTVGRNSTQNKLIGTLRTTGRG